MTRSILIALLLWSAAPVALAGPPFTTDDPEPVEYRHWEIYLGSQHYKTADEWEGKYALLELNFGLLPNVQIHFIAPLAYVAPVQGTRHVGYGDTELGLKYRFIQETAGRPQVGTFPILELPTGNADRDLGSGHLRVFLPLWLQKSWGAEGHQWTAYGGGGYHIDAGEGNRNWTYFGAVLERQITAAFLLGGEVFRRSATHDGERADLLFDLGTEIDFTEQHHLLFSVGRSIDGPTQLQLYAAYELELGD